MFQGLIAKRPSWNGALPNSVSRWPDEAIPGPPTFIINARQMGSEQDQAPDNGRESDEPLLYCPVCSRRLVEMKCKLVCEQCGYYMSCADYY